MESDDYPDLDLGNQCTRKERKKIIAGDLSMMHVYFKDTHIRKYLKEENFGTVDAIGNFIITILSYMLDSVR